MFTRAALRTPEVVKGRGVLRGVEVDQTKIVGDDPLERVQVESALQARHRRYMHALSSQCRRVGGMAGRAG